MIGAFNNGRAKQWDIMILIMSKKKKEEYEKEQKRIDAVAERIKARILHQGLERTIAEFLVRGV